MLEHAVCEALAVIGVRGRIVGHVEREPHAASALVAGMGPSGMGEVPVWDDARTFHGRRWRGCVDILTAGYPCQPLSFAGKRRGAGDDRHLWPEVRRAIEEIQPGLVFLENVEGHLSLGADTVFEDLERLGYAVTCGLFTANEVGAPHERRRLFILGLADTERGWAHEPTSGRGDGTRITIAGPGKTVADGPSGGCPGAPQRDGGELADAEHAGPRPGAPGIEGAPRGGRRGSSDGRDGLPMFPPGRDDFGAWAAVLGMDPSLAPCIESGVPAVADGLASRADRLRLGGNGVVPLAAAYAFLSLFAGLRG